MDTPQEPPLSTEAAHAVAAICLRAAFADGQKSSAEGAQLKEIYASLGDVELATLYGRVMLGQTSLADEAAALGTPELRAFAFEMALSVCDADGVTNEAEGRFLGELQAALHVPREEAAAARQDAEALAALPVTVAVREEAVPASSPAALKPAAPEPATSESPASTPDDGALDRLILNAAVLNGGLELLPQSLATVAIVPLQLRMVYQIGQAYGYTLGREHLREFLAIAGVGMTSQVVEGHVRKLFGSLAKRTAGKAAKGVASTAAGAAMSFATTYALGVAAKSYYGGGRKLELAEVRALFQNRLEEGRALFEQHRGEVQEKASTTDLQSLLKLVR